MKTEDFRIFKERSLKRGWLYTLTHPDWSESSPDYAVAYAPTAEDIRGAIETVINEHTRTKITENFIFDFGEDYGQCRVWLSTENQANYAAYLKAVELGAESITLKVEDANGATCYANVKATRYVEFYMSLVAHIKTQIENGWREKDAINYDLLASIAAEL